MEDERNSKTLGQRIIQSSLTPDYGRRLLPHVIDERAHSGHARPFASIPCGTKAEDGFEDISYARFANAINRCARWLISVLGAPSEDTAKTVVYIGPQDLRYHVFVVACVKSGCIAFLPSPRNSLDAFDSLIEQTGACHLFSPENPLPIVNTLANRSALPHTFTPSLVELLDQTSVPDVPFHGRFDEYRFRPFVYLHTSGSTGTPKIVPIKHGLLSNIDAYSLLDVNEAADRYGNMRILVPFPSFHMAGLSYGLWVPVWVDSTLVMPLPGVPTAESCCSVLEHGSAEHAILAPSILIDIAKSPDQMSQLARLDGITYSGGPIDEGTARKVAKLTTLTSAIGATEYGGTALFAVKKSPEDTNYIAFNQEASGVEFQEVEGQPGLYEMVFVRDPHLELFQPIFVTFPDIDEYHTKDCFTPHPTTPGLWKYEARLDDVIVLSNGEKLNPVSMEGTITSCPDVRGCLVIGQGRFQVALLVEPKDFEQDIRSLLASISPYVAEANKIAPNYGRISEDFVIVTTLDKPLPRAAKGTIQRGPSNKLYQEEIENLYAALDAFEQGTPSKKLDLSSLQQIQASLREHICEQLGVDRESLNLQDDLFSVGLDSLQVLGLVRTVNNSQESGKSAVNTAFIYEHPTIEKLAEALCSGAMPREYSDFGDDDEFTKKTWESMEETYRRLRVGGKRNTSRNDGWLLRTLDIMKSHATPPLYQPDGGWTAWLQVLGSFLVNVNNWGLINSFGAYQAYYETQLLPGYSPSNIAWIGTLQGTLLLVVGVVSGSLFDRGYFRFILLLASAGIVFGLMMLSLARNFYSIMLAQGVLIGLCLGLLYIPSVALVQLFFKRKRGFALGIATSGGAFGGVIYPIMFRRLLDQLGFAWANRIMGFVALATLAVAGLLLRPVGARAPRELVDIAAFKEPAYTCFAIGGFIIFAGVLAPYFLVPTFASDVLTVPQDLSFYLLSVMNGAQFFGRIVPAALSDWIGAEVLLVSAQVAAAILGLCWIAVRSLDGFIVWLIIYGFVSGMIVTLPAAVMPFLCSSMAVIGTRLGMVYAAAGLGFLISTPIALSLTSSSSNADRFLGAQIWIGACCIVASVFVGISALTVWKKRRLYERNISHSSSYLFRNRRKKAVEKA